MRLNQTGTVILEPGHTHPALMSSARLRKLRKRNRPNNITNQVAPWEVDWRRMQYIARMGGMYNA